MSRAQEERGSSSPIPAASQLRGDSAASATHTESAPAVAAGAVPSPWLPGTEFSKYEIDSRLAAGGMAEVWRAKIKGAQGFQKRIVIKTMLTALQSRPELVQMFISEASIAAQLGHANIVHIFDFGQLEGRYFIAMEYVPGVTLRVAHKRMVARGERLPVPTVLHVMMDVCDALEHVHAAVDARGTLGLVHRDISPDNVIISTSGSAKLIDFGAARASTRTPPTPVFVGKYRYAAPERIRRVSEDRRSDIYSAGVILYECLAGKRPFDGTDADVIKAALASRGCDPRARVPDLPASLAKVVLKATAPDPADRYATARELRQALADCLEAVGGTNKERDVTAALADLQEAPAPPAPPPARARALDAEAVPEPIGASASETAERTPSDDLALCEVEILDASGPIRMPVEPPPAPPRAVVMPAVATSRPAAPRPPAPPAAKAPTAKAPAPSTISIFSARGGAAVERSARERAVELFDRGVSFRGSGRYGEALDAWEKALALAPENRIYQANVQRLRSDLGRLRAHTPAIDVAGALRVQRPTLGPDAGVGLYRLLRLVAFDTMTGAEAVAAAHAAGEKIGRSLGVGKLDDLVALCASLKIGVVEAKVVTESSVRVVVRECVACAGAHHGHPGGTPTCHFEGGVFAGAVAPIFRRSVRVRETACIGGCGDDACRFEITFT